MATDAKTLLAQANCYACYTTMEWDLLALALLAQWVNNAAVAPIDPAVSAWQARVIANGGTVSNATISKANTFWRAVKSAGFDSKFYVLNFFAPDSWIACITPFILGTGGNDPWASFDNGGGGINPAQPIGNGIQGNAIDALNLGWSPVNLSGTNAGMTVYRYTAASNPATDEFFGGDIKASGQYLELSYQTQFFCHGLAPALIHADPGGTDFLGYCSCNMLNGNGTMYQANSTTPHALVQTQVGMQQNNQPDTPVMIFAVGDDGALSNASDVTISFAAIHQALTATESLAFYNAVQALRVALGGGFK